MQELHSIAFGKFIRLRCLYQIKKCMKLIIGLVKVQWLRCYQLFNLLDIIKLIAFIHCWLIEVPVRFALFDFFSIIFEITWIHIANMNWYLTGHSPLIEHFIEPFLCWLSCNESNFNFNTYKSYFKPISGYIPNSCRKKNQKLPQNLCKMPEFLTHLDTSSISLRPQQSEILWSK